MKELFGDNNSLEAPAQPANAAAVAGNDTATPYRRWLLKLPDGTTADVTTCPPQPRAQMLADWPAAIDATPIDGEMQSLARHSSGQTHKDYSAVAAYSDSGLAVI